jgi:hypothetical protein
MTNKQSWVENKDLEYFYFTKFDDDRDFCKELREYINNLLSSKSEQMERESVKIPKGKHTGKSWCPQCEDEGFNAGISKAIEILKK